MILSRLVSGVATNNISSLIREINAPRSSVVKLKIESALDHSRATKLVRAFNRSAQAVLRKLESKVEPKRTLAQSLAFVLNNDAGSNASLNVSEATALFDFKVPRIDTQSKTAVDNFFAGVDEAPEKSVYALTHEFDGLEAFTNLDPSLASGDFEAQLPEADKSLQLDISNSQAVLGILFKTVDTFCDLFRKNFLQMGNLKQTDELTQELEIGLGDFHKSIDLILRELTSSSLVKLESVYSRMGDFSLLFVRMN